MPTTAHKTLNSEIQVEIASTLTEIPGVTGFELKLGESVIVEKASLTSDFVEKINTGVQEGGSISGELIWDHADSVHQFLQARKNDGAEITGAVVLGATGVTLNTTMTLKTFDINGAHKDIFRIPFEFELTDRVDLPES